MLVYVTSAQDAAALDAAAIDAGIPSRALMRVAGSHAATIIAERYGDRLGDGVVVFTGAGNNGGDGWVVAQALAAAGHRVTVCEVDEARSVDARAERDLTSSGVERGPAKRCGIVVDAVLGTGAHGAPNDAVAKAITAMAGLRAEGACVIALDVPSGVDATTGVREGAAVVADLTVTFGSCKRGLLIAREHCGAIVTVDIGLLADKPQTLPVLIDATFVKTHTPSIAFDAHKGIRRKLGIVAGAAGMGGAALLAAEAALRSGIGMVKVATDSSNVTALQARLPEALTTALPGDEASAKALAHWADALLVGPGLGATPEVRRMVDQLLDVFDGPVVLDADALNIYAGDLDALGRALRGRPAVITPHPLEFARLIGADAETVLAERFDAGVQPARMLNAVVLLKGTPTVVFTPAGDRYVIAAGTAALGTGGSGDALGGIIATLLAQTDAPEHAAACGAWIHGRAAERCGVVRGTTLHDVLDELRAVWSEPAAASRYPAIAELSAVETPHARIAMNDYTHRT